MTWIDEHAISSSLIGETNTCGLLLLRLWAMWTTLLRYPSCPQPLLNALACAGAQPLEEHALSWHQW